MKKTVLPILLIILLLTSCIPKTNLQDRSLVMAMAIDYSMGEYKLTLQNFKASESGEKNSNISSGFLSASGETLFEALKNAEAKEGKQIFYGHSKVFIIGKKAAENGMKPILEFMNSNYQISLNSSVMLAKDTAEEILNTNIFSNDSPDISLEIIQDSGKSVDSTVIDVLKTAHILDGNFILPMISASEENVVIEECCCFKDAVPFITLNNEEVMGYNWINSNIKDGILTVNENDKNEIISVNVTLEDCKTTLETDKEKMTLSIDIKTHGNISETGVSKNHEMNSEYIKNVEKSVEDKIENQINSVIESTLKNGYDIFYIKKLLKKEDVNLYNKIIGKPISSWLPDIEYDISVEFNITHLGVQVK